MFFGEGRRRQGNIMEKKVSIKDKNTEDDTDVDSGIFLRRTQEIASGHSYVSTHVVFLNLPCSYLTFDARPSTAVRRNVHLSPLSMVSAIFFLFLTLFVN